MSNTKILVIGSTGMLGKKLLKFCHNNEIPIYCITCFKNIDLMKKMSQEYKIKQKFCLSKATDYNNFLLSIKKINFNLIYFLDFGSGSLNLLSKILLHNKNSYIAIANKEMIIAGGKFMIKEIKKSGNKFIPLDSEHYSLINSPISNHLVKKVYITASGGPFYYKKNINLESAPRKLILSHPKWKMGLNNLIDSSNFINKVLEMYELSSIFNISIDKIDFLISPEAYIHSIVEYKNNIVSYNSFSNNMLIALTYPLSFFYEFNFNINKNVIKDLFHFKLEKRNDKRFIIFKFLSKLKKLNHRQQINFMILNNIAQKLFLENKIKYNDIFNFILSNLDFKTHDYQFNSFDEIISYIDSLKFKYNNLLND